MRAGFVVKSSIFKRDTFILVSNFHRINVVSLISFSEKSTLNNLNPSSMKARVGFWRIKRKETIK